MFERYNEKARRVIFFGHYEASQFGSPYIETEHLLLGVLREDKALTNRFLRSHDPVELIIRKQIEAHTVVGEKISTSVDLPLSNESKRVLAYAAEEAERLGRKHIGTEHLFLGLLREEKCFAAEMLNQRGVLLKTVREELARDPHRAEETRAADTPDPSHIRDLTRAALEGQLAPVLGRDLEIDAVIDILSRFRNGNPVLVGEPGAGKTSIAEAVAQRIADGSAPQLTGKRVVVFDRQLAGTQVASRAVPKIADESGTIVFVGDLRSLLGAGVGFGIAGAAGSLRPSPFQGQVRCIATSTDPDYNECLRAAPWLRDVFRAVYIHPLDKCQTLSILGARKAQYEAFHHVSYSEEALQCAVESAGRYLPDHALPGKALELLDAAAVRLKRQHPPLPEEVMEVNKRIQFMAQRMDSAIGNHEFEKAKFYGDEEKKERENLRALREKHQFSEPGEIVVRREDIEAVITSWSEYPFQP